ncbi:hypothetical protein HDU87_005620 [Geranomyces variabilis]|uniref:Tudor domain-containing protein n=1 Tax=Geranomyces variabilis TaxID=109894 RepID=A0AAD5XNZ8_9FUNG|nr:hypothetical protein HDU87_005620 [Geranomyces variabilis]
MAQELAQYQFQLDQVDEALAKDPENDVLAKLRGDLTELITLYTSVVQDQQVAAAAASSKKKQSAASAPEPKKWKVGDTVSAKYGPNGKFYEGVVAALPEQTPEGRYSIVFAGYSTPESVDPADVRDPSAQPTNTSSAAGHNKKRPIEAPVTAATMAAGGNPDGKKKKKFKPKEAGGPSKRDKEHVQKQEAWLSFAAGSGSKKRKTAGVTAKPLLKKPSMFATPEDPTARVGVIGSGKPMTQFQQRGKHVFHSG